MGFSNGVRNLKEQLRSLEPISLKVVFSSASKLFLENFILFVSIYTPALFPYLIQQALGSPKRPRRIYLIPQIISVIIGIFSSAATITAVSQRYSGEPINFVQAFRKTWGKYISYFGAGFAYGLQVVFGLVLLIFPGLYVLAAYFCAPVIAVLDPRMDSFQTSRTLVRGSFIKVLILALSGAAVHAIVITSTRLNNGIQAGYLLSIIFSCLWGPFWMTMGVILYQKLKERKDLQVKCGQAKLKFYGFFKNEKSEKVSWSFEAPNEKDLLMHLEKTGWQVLEIKKVCYED